MWSRLARMARKRRFALAMPRWGTSRKGRARGRATGTVAGVLTLRRDTTVQKRLTSSVLVIGLVITLGDKMASNASGMQFMPPNRIRELLELQRGTPAQLPKKGQLRPPVVEGVPMFPAQPLGANPVERQGDAPIFNGPIQVRQPDQPPKEKPTRSVLMR